MTKLKVVGKKETLKINKEFVAELTEATNSLIKDIEKSKAQLNSKNVSEFFEGVCFLEALVMGVPKIMQMRNVGIRYGLIGPDCRIQNKEGLQILNQTKDFDATEHTNFFESNKKQKQDDPKKSIMDFLKNLFQD